ncbi:MAG: phage virion morphogenesis protein [Magnetococcales bacterium]|nr:phage virion morphogenesis protein [Magnetococcales bacterium]
MTADPIRIFIDERPIAALLTNLMERGADLSVPFLRIAGVMEDAVAENFEQEGRPERWTRLDDKTIEARRKQGVGGIKKLQDTGRLAASITSTHDALSATMGTNTIYAAIHHFGGQAGRGRKVTIPARPFLQLADDDREEVIDILARHLTHG